MATGKVYMVRGHLLGKIWEIVFIWYLCGRVLLTVVRVKSIFEGCRR